MLRRRLFGLQIVLWALVVPPLALAWPAIARKLDAPELAKATGFLLAAGVLSSFGTLVDSYLRSFRLYKLSAPLTHLVPRGLILGGFLLLLYTYRGQAALGDAGRRLRGSAADQLASATPWRSSGRPRRSLRAAHRLEPPGYREILGTSTAMGLRSAASVIFVSSSLWILSWARPHEEVAVYGVAATLLQLMAAIPEHRQLRGAAGVRAALRRRQEGRSGGAGAHGGDPGGHPLGRLPRRPAAARPAPAHLAYGDTYVAAWRILLILAVGSFWDPASGGAGYALQMSGAPHRPAPADRGGGAALNGPRAGCSHRAGAATASPSPPR